MKDSHTFTGWNSTGGTLPATFPVTDETYTAQWETNATPPMPENLVKNADFSKLIADTSKFNKYWADEKKPASWNTWASAANTADVTFTATDGKFTIQAGNTPFTKGGLQQPITLDAGTQYTLSVTVKLTNLTGGRPKGGCEIKLCNGKKQVTGGTETITMEITGEDSPKLELLANGLQNKKIEFSAITLTKK